MKELKFRAWDKVTKRYYAVSGLEYDDNGNLCEVYLAGIQIDESNPYANVRKPSDVILEQDTGLKDKNGKEIYEGDIVKLTGRVAKNESTLYKVVWDDFLTGYDLINLERSKDDVGYLNKYNIKENFEVIGNIHENSELLEKK